MKRIYLLNKIIELFVFKVIKDEYGNEYVVFDKNPITNVMNIYDKTEFEAIENHLHLLDGVRKKEFNELIVFSERLGEILLDVLKKSFPDKYFYVFITVTLHGSFIVRFHQKWEGEEPYYNIVNHNGRKDKIIMVEG